MREIFFNSPLHHLHHYTTYATSPSRTWMEDQWRYYAVYSPKQHIHTSYTTYTTYATFASGLAMTHALTFYLRSER